VELVGSIETVFLFALQIIISHVCEIYNGKMDAADDVTAGNVDLLWVEYTEVQ
jgi:hypothetical protein